jgi:hypothetical protein
MSMGPPDGGGRTGTPNLIAGSPNLIASRPTVIAGSPTVIAGSPTVIAGPPNLVAGPPNLIAGSPTVIAGPPNLIAGSPTVIAGPPTVIAGSPNLIADQPTVIAGPPTVIAGSPNLIAGQPTVIAGQPAVIAGQPTITASHPTLPLGHPCLALRLSTNPTPAAHPVLAPFVYLLVPAATSPRQPRRTFMRLTLPLTALITVALVFGAGCKKKSSDDEDKAATATAAPPPPPPPPPPTATASAGPGEVARYPDEVPMGTVTVELLRDFAVHQAADLNSPILTHVGRGVMINVKATHSNWMLIEYPSGVAQMSPGWIDLRNVYDPRVRVHNGPPAVPARLPGGRQPHVPPPPRRR